MYQIGVDIGGTNIKIGLINDALEICARAVTPFPHGGGAHVAHEIALAVRKMLAEEKIEETAVSGIGVVLPGSIDASGQTVIDAHNLGFHNEPFRSRMEHEFPNLPVRMANDADGAALAELYCGAFKGCRSAVLMTLGTGLGGGVILDGRMFCGGRGQGVELGHMILVDGGEKCTCGNAGCMEAYCSASALAREGVREMQAHPESMIAEKSGGDAARVDARLVTDCAKAGDAAANAAFSRYVGHLSSACASIFNLLDPEVVAIGGGLCAAGEFLFAPLNAQVDAKCFFPSRGKIVPAVLGNDAGMIGAAMLYQHEQEVLSRTK